ncbi:MAG: hypothetical protein WEC33_07325, partial [Dehalococcoidia bacterium]
PVRGGERPPGRERYQDRPNDVGGGDGRQLLAVLLGGIIFLLVGVYSLKQQAAEPAATNVLEEGIAATTDIDLLLAEELPALRERAAEGDDALLAVPGFPIAVFLTANEVLSLEEEEIRARLLSEAASVVYVQGFDAFDATGSQSLPFFSAEGMAYRLMDRLDARTEDRAGLLSLVLAAAAAGAGVLVFAMGDGLGRFRALGLPLVLGAIPGILATLLFKGLFSALGGGDSYSSDLLTIVNALADVALRNYVIVASLGGFTIAIGSLLALLDRRLLGSRAPNLAPTRAPSRPIPRSQPREFEPPVEVVATGDGDDRF